MSFLDIFFDFDFLSTGSIIDSMSTLELRNRIKSINYEKNLRKLLGWEDFDARILRKSAGILKGVLKKSGVAYQREMRKEWETRIKKLERLSKK